jgi:hypothetical protein
VEAVLQFLYGGVTVMFLAVGFFFLRYWREARDRLFLFFMVAFWSLAGSWSVHLFYATSSETGPTVYIFRVVAFILIILAIVDKNRRARAGP